MEQSKPSATGRLEELFNRSPEKLNMVTGAFSYTGRYITERLLSLGEEIRTLTGHPEKNQFGNKIEVFPYNFDKPKKLVESLNGIETLYNTYWIRFSYKDMTFDRAVNNTKILIESAQKAEVKKIVHISITNANEKSSLPYFRGKGIIEKLIKTSDLSYAILRPALIFGKENTLINNIAWMLRKFPIFNIFGDGNYKLQPIYVEDLAELAVEAGHENENIIIDAVGETFTFNELVHLIKNKISSNAKVFHLPPRISLTFSKIMSKFVNDIVVTEDEVNGLMANLLYSQNPSKNKTKLSSWLEENSRFIGNEYISQLKMHYL